MTTANNNLPEGYSLDTTEEYQPGKVKYVVLRSSGRIGEGWHMGEKDAVEEAWGDYYERVTDAYNEGKTLSETRWGYFLPNGEFRHPGCIRQAYRMDELVPATIATRGTDIKNDYCAHDDDYALSIEDQEEFFGLDQPDEGETADQVEAYTLEHSSYSADRIEGYRSGLIGYAEMRHMSLEEYMNWTGVVAREDFKAGYEDAQNEEEE